MNLSTTRTIDPVLFDVIQEVFVPGGNNDEENSDQENNPQGTSSVIPQFKKRRGTNFDEGLLKLCSIYDYISYFFTSLVQLI